MIPRHVTISAPYGSEKDYSQQAARKKHKQREPDRGYPVSLKKRLLRQHKPSQQFSKEQTGGIS